MHPSVFYQVQFLLNPFQMKARSLLLLLFVFFFTQCTEDESGMYGEYLEFSGSEQYNEYEENPFVSVAEQPVSTFSVDADGGAYSNMRRFLVAGQEVPKAAIRTEELMNYFNYNYPEPEGDHSISLNGEVSQCPWTAENKLIRIGLKGKAIPKEQLPAANLVLLIDVSGSMGSKDKLELLKSGFIEFVNQLRPQDKLAIVTYAGNAGLVLGSTSGSEKSLIIQKIESLGSGGSTAGAEGIITAYEIAKENFVAGGNNRVILGSDGDFNVGPSSQEELIALIEKKRDEGIFLTVVGVGRGNLNDAMMEQVANHGNGNYEYLDSFEQARKVFVEEWGKFYTVAKDVKVQVEFNPELVEAYRLIGYENRLLEEEDFEDDTKDAAEIGADQSITALYEIVPKETSSTEVVPSFSIDFRYKQPTADDSRALTLNVIDYGHSFGQASEDMRFAASLAGLGMHIRESAFKGNLSLDAIRQWAAGASSFDPYGYKKKHLELLQKVPE